MKLNTLTFSPPDGREFSWFHPGICGPQPDLLLTFQTCSGRSDCYGDPMWSRSPDAGETWGNVHWIESLRSRRISALLREAVADIRPFRMGARRLVMGCTIFYGANGAARYDAALRKLRPPARTVYSVLDGDCWGGREVLELPGWGDSLIQRVACAQVAVLSDEEVLLPFYVSLPRNEEHFAVVTARARFDGARLEIVATGEPVLLAAGRGALEPSVWRSPRGFELTIRAEDCRGYHATSRDGLRWGECRPWCWEDGTELEMSSTQQHWFGAGDRLFLAYTRRTPENQDHFRFRGPVFCAEYDWRREALLRESETVVIPLESCAGVRGRLGNFHVAEVAAGRFILSDAALFLFPDGRFESRLKLVRMEI